MGFISVFIFKFLISKKSKNSPTGILILPLSIIFFKRFLSLIEIIIDFKNFVLSLSLCKIETQKINEQFVNFDIFLILLTTIMDLKMNEKYQNLRLENIFSV